MVKRITLMAAFMVVAGSAQVQVKPTLLERLESIFKSAQSSVRPAIGPDAGQNFTSEDKKRFDSERRAERIASEFSMRPDFRSAVQSLAKSKKEEQQRIIKALLDFHQKTVAENGGTWGPNSQTNAGQDAQSDIAKELVNSIEQSLKKR